MAAECRRRELGLLVGDDVGDDRLAEERSGDADDRCHADALGSVQDRLDLAWGDLLAARLEDVVAAADEVEVAVLVRRKRSPVASIRSHGQRPGRSRSAVASGSFQ